MVALLDPFIAGFTAGMTYQVAETLLNRWRRRKPRKPQPGESYLVAPWQMGGMSASDNLNNGDPSSWGGGSRWSGIDGS